MTFPDPVSDGGERALRGRGGRRRPGPQLVGQHDAAPVRHPRRDGRQLPERLPLEVGGGVRSGQLGGDGEEDVEAVLQAELHLYRVHYIVRIAGFGFGPEFDKSENLANFDGILPNPSSNPHNSTDESIPCLR